MSNSLAIATVTATLQNLLQSAFQTNQPDQLAGAAVTTLPLGDVPADARGANVYLYQVSENQSLKNQVLPWRGADGTTVRPPQIALDLHYLISFYGAANKLEPERFLGVALRTLNALPVLTKQMVAQTVQMHGAAGANLDFLVASDLSDGPQLVRLTPISISLEELSKLWSILLQKTYVLSALYIASVVLIDSPEPSVTALPVLTNNVVVNVTSILSAVQVITTDTTTFGAILSGARVAVLGRGLTAPGLAVIVDGVNQLAALPLVTDNRIEFNLSAALPAGPHSLRLQTFFGTNPLPTNETAPLSFTLRPFITGAIGKSITPASPPPTVWSGSLSVPVSPRVAATQRKSLLLDRKDLPAGSPPAGAVLPLSPALPGDITDTDVLTFPFTGLPAGRYAVRLRVDDAESPPVLSPVSPPTSPPSSTLGPEVVIP